MISFWNIIEPIVSKKQINCEFLKFIVQQAFSTLSECKFEDNAAETLKRFVFLILTSEV
jgi:hypothetical protein